MSYFLDEFKQALRTAPKSYFLPLIAAVGGIATAWKVLAIQQHTNSK